eukprot:Em0242g7a
MSDVIQAGVVTYRAVVLMGVEILQRLNLLAALCPLACHVRVRSINGRCLPDAFVPVQELRSQMDCYTAMVTVGGGDDLSPIILTASSPFEDSDGRNFNLNNNSLLWATYLGFRGAAVEVVPALPLLSALMIALDIAGKKMGVGQKSQSGEQGKSLHSEPPKTPPIVVLGCNSNSNNNNNSLDTSPLQLLTIPPQIVPALPITPPRNPYEDQDHEGLDPKTLKKLQLHK